MLGQPKRISLLGLADLYTLTQGKATLTLQTLDEACHTYFLGS